MQDCYALPVAYPFVIASHTDKTRAKYERRINSMCKIKFRRSVRLQILSPNRKVFFLLMTLSKEKRTNQMNSPSDLELATGIIPSGSGEKKGRRGSHAVAPDDLQGLCAQIKALHVENNALRAQMTLVPRRLNSKIESYLATVAAVPSSSNQRETLGAKEMKRLKTYFYLLERERKRLLALKKSAASKRPVGNDQNVGAPRSLYSVVPLTTSGDISDFPFSP